MKVNIYDLMENIEDSSVRMEDNSVVSSERIKELTRMKIQNASNKKRSSKKTILTVGIATPSSPFHQESFAIHRRDSREGSRHSNEQYTSHQLWAAL